MIELPDITLICVDCQNPGGGLGALQLSLQQIKPARAVLLTNVDIKINGIEVIVIPSIKSKKEYSEFILKHLNEYFETKYVLTIQADGYVICGEAWEEEFYEYDFIGAPWLYIDGRNVGNGGCCLKSKKLTIALANDAFIQTCDPEDEIIGRLYRHYLEDKYGIKYPSEELADKFSFELREPKTKTFAFHGNFHKPYQKTAIIRRYAALGDVISVEPILLYFHLKGYRVVFDTLPQFKELFYNHYFSVFFLEEMDKRILENAERYNLDMSYESKPKQLHQKTYFEFCGIPEKEIQIRKPKLSLQFDPKSPENKLFKKYACLHLDKREQASRNIEGVDWYKVVQYLIKEGFTVLNIGKGEHIEITGVIEMNTPSLQYLMWVIGGADLFIGIDSSISHIASAFDVPSIIFFGNVNPGYIHTSFQNKHILQNHTSGKKICDKPFCWHDAIGCAGTRCYIDNENPPCNKFNSQRVIEGIQELCESQ